MGWIASIPVWLLCLLILGLSVGEAPEMQRAGCEFL